jgi:hypothetical protein
MAVPMSDLIASANGDCCFSCHKPHRDRSGFG